MVIVKRCSASTVIPDSSSPLCSPRSAALLSSLSPSSRLAPSHVANLALMPAYSWPAVSKAEQPKPNGFHSLNTGPILKMSFRFLFASLEIID